MIVCDPDINYGSILLVDFFDYFIEHSFNCLCAFFGNIQYSDASHFLFKISHKITNQTSWVDLEAFLLKKKRKLVSRSSEFLPLSLI